MRPVLHLHRAPSDDLAMVSVPSCSGRPWHSQSGLPTRHEARQRAAVTRRQPYRRAPTCVASVQQPEAAGEAAEEAAAVALRDGEWDDYVDDWWDFWTDEEASAELFDEIMDAQEEGSVSVKQRGRQHVGMLLKRLPYLQDRPDFVGQLPVPIKERIGGALPDPSAKDKPNPEWDEWELRAFMEKRRAKARAQAAWDERRATVGRFSYLAPTWRNDLRLEGQEEPEWTHEQIMNLITMDGVSPTEAEIPHKVEDPEGINDYTGAGVTYIPETEELLASWGHWMENVSQQELDKEVTLLASEFADFEDGMQGSGLMLGDEGDGNTGGREEA